jgi:hypothetical protein
MRYLLCAMLVLGLVGCGDSADNNVSAKTSDASKHEHKSEHEHRDEHAHDRVEHFEGKQAKDWQAAIANLRKYNQKLEAALEQDEISAEQLAEIHKWSYTLENAVGRLQTELKKTAGHLEEVHLGSERGETERIRKHGRKYLEKLEPLLKEGSE